jgi:hypothetical protein
MKRPIQAAAVAAPVLSPRENCLKMHTRSLCVADENLLSRILPDEGTVGANPSTV